MDHDRHAPDRFEPERFGGAFIVHPVDLLDFQEMVARPEAAHLVLASRGGAVAHVGEIGVGQATFRLDVVGILRPRIPFADRPLDSVGRHLRQVLPRDLHQTSLPHAARDVLEAGVRQGPEVRPHLGFRQVRPDEPYAAVDVVSDPSRGNHPVLVVEGGDPADRKPVSPMDVRHRHRLADDPRHRRHVGDLFRSPVLAEQREQRLIDEDEAVRPHFTFVGPRDLVSKAVHLFQGTVPAFDHWHREEEQTKECT